MAEKNQKKLQKIFDMRKRRATMSSVNKIFIANATGGNIIMREIVTVNFENGDVLMLNKNGPFVQIDQRSGADDCGDACGWIYFEYTNNDGWEITAQAAFGVAPSGEVSVYSDHGAEIIRIDNWPDDVELTDEIKAALEEHLFEPGECELLSKIAIDTSSPGWVHICEKDSAA